MRRCAAAAFVVLSLSAGLTTACTSPAEPTVAVAPGSVSSPAIAPAPVATPPPAPLRLSRAQMAETLPAAGDIYPWRVRARCVLKGTCGEYDDGDGHGMYVHARKDVAGRLDPYFLIALSRWPTAERAVRAREKSYRATRKQHQGVISEPGERHTDPETHWHLGVEGRGWYGPTERVGWIGYTGLKKTRYVFEDGGLSRRFIEIRYLVQRDRYVAQVDIALPATDGGATIRAEALETLDDLIERTEALGSAGTSATG